MTRRIRDYLRACKIRVCEVSVKQAGQEGADVFKVTISLEPQSLPIFCAVVPSMPAVDMSALRIGMDIRIDVRIEIQAG